MYQELAEILFPEIKMTIQDYLLKYPNRPLDKKNMVTRFAPSPTGSVHIGSLYASFLSHQMAKQTGGVFYLRIEDTDQKREVENGISGIINDLEAYHYEIKEGPSQGGSYGPYIQSERKEIYQTFVKDLVRRGLAYPCFLTSEELDLIRKEQEEKKERIGYYGKYAVGRNLSLEEIKEKLKQGTPYVIRLKSPGDFDKTVSFHDCIKGQISFPENDMDIVLLKQDGIPTYHLAHVIDDTLMHTTHVIRGDEWLSSVPVHLQLFQVFGFKAPKYAHIAPLTKKEGESVRKFSKRKDPEASIRYYQEQGIPIEVVKLYLATISNTNFEMWYQQNPTLTMDDFSFQFQKMPIGGTLFDLEKLTSISRIWFSIQKAEDLYFRALEYFKEYDEEFYQLILKNKEKTISFLNIEREIARPRKDLASYQDIKKEFENFYDEIYEAKTEEELYRELPEDKVYSAELLLQYQNIYESADDKDTWMNRLKKLAQENGYAAEVKEYKQNPELYKGHIGDVCETVRVCLTGKTKSPDLYELLKIIGKDSFQRRVQKFIQFRTSDD